MSISAQDLLKEIDVADWALLRAHLERGGVIVVDLGLNLAEVGAYVAADDMKTINAWITAGKLGKPAATDIARWDREGQIFNVLVISPFVLIQEVPPQPAGNC